MRSSGVRGIAERLGNITHHHRSSRPPTPSQEVPRPQISVPLVGPPPPPPKPAYNAPRILVIGAGSRGVAYTKCIVRAGSAAVVAVAEPDDFKHDSFGRRFIWGEGCDAPTGSSFKTWQDFVRWEHDRRRHQVTSPNQNEDGEQQPPPAGIDAAFVCVQDEQHRAVVEALAPLGIHIMCEKPLATSLDDCIAVLKTLQQGPPIIFGIGHVLRYSPHNVMLRKLLLEQRVIGDVLSVVHTEPVGYWHFAHSYVRGNWRREDTSAPSLLTKSCHDIDILLWLLCSPSDISAINAKPHLPSTVSSTGSLQLYKKSRKPREAKHATNCMSCPLRYQCKFSAQRVYLGEFGLGAGNTGWPVKIVLPEIEEYGVSDEGRRALADKLAEDYTAGKTPEQEIRGRSWYGRCVYESDNNVCDDQVVTITWDEDPLDGEGPEKQTQQENQRQQGQQKNQGPQKEQHQFPQGTEDPSERPRDPMGGRGAKQATFHMVAYTHKICDRFSRFYGTEGELETDSHVIKVTDFATGLRREFYPGEETLSHHGGGDNGLAGKFVEAVSRVKNNEKEEGYWTVERAQRKIVGCTLDEIVRSHAIVFAAEESRRTGQRIDWRVWWEKMVIENL